MLSSYFRGEKKLDMQAARVVAPLTGPAWTWAPALLVRLDRANLRDLS
jgi:hypothetical protein